MLKRLTKIIERLNCPTTHSRTEMTFDTMFALRLC